MNIQAHVYAVSIIHSFMCLLLLNIGSKGPAGESWKVDQCRRSYYSLVILLLQTPVAQLLKGECDKFLLIT